MALAMFIAGVIITLMSLNPGSVLPSPYGAVNSHPLLIIHARIYRACLALTLVMYPALQVRISVSRQLQMYFASDLMFHPLRTMTLCVLSIYRFSEVITQLDYRNTGDDGGVAWSLFSIADFFASCVSFATLVVCAILIGALHAMKELNSQI